MPSTLGIVQHTESFAEALKDLAEEAGIDRVEVVEGPDGVSEMSVVGLVLSVGGSEDVATGLIRELVPRTSAAVVVVGADADHHLAAALVREGARELYVLPQDVGMLRSWLEERAERAREAESSAALRRAEVQQYAFDGIIGDSPGLKEALARVARIIPRDGVTVLITGETGTGKELVAQALHYNGPRGAGPFVEVNCAALPASLLEAELFGYEKGAFTDARTAKPGLFEAADGGTLFLDEVGDLAPDLQVKLLKVLEDRRIRRLGSVRSRDVDIRLVAATHVDLVAAVRDGSFREDLYYRLNVIPVHLPPLRERAGDVLLLARHFVRATAERYGLDEPELPPAVASRLRAYDWPGNVRELRNAVERAVLLGDRRLRADDLALGGLGIPGGQAGPLPFPATLEEIERAAAHAALERESGNKSAAAQLLGISRTRLYRLLDDA